MWAVGVLIVAAIVGAIIYAATGKQTNPNKMEPLGLDKFQVTQSNEGECIPLVWGTVKITSNILWYGNLISQEIHAENPGGKGMGGQSPTTGYTYYLDLWKGLCWSPHGGVSLIDVYSSDKSVGLAGLGTYTLNPGNTNYYPTEPGALANRLHGLAHIFLKTFCIGEQNSQGYVPNLTFVIKNTSPCPLTYANMTTGVNPAAIIYDMLIYGDVSASDIDLVSFQSAATYWYNKNYGLNIVMNSQGFIDEKIGQLLTYVDFALYQDNEGRWHLAPYKNTDVSTGTGDVIETEDVKDFQFIRKSWDDTFNDFRGTFTDAGKDYTQRVITVYNAASGAMLGYRNQKSIDLSAVNDLDVASKRLDELMKVMSYPSSAIQTSVPYRFITLQVGQVVEVNNTDYGIDEGQYRVVSIDETDDSNYVKLSLSQKMEGLFDDTYAVGGGSQWVAPDYTPETLAYQGIFELPYSDSFGTTPTFICLGQRKGAENGFSVYGSSTLAGTFTFIKNITSFSTRGTLGVTYPNTTYSLDDETGITFTPYALDPAWTSVSRTDLFNTHRVVICGNEIMTFQTITALGGGVYKLTGVCRGVLGTSIETHTAGTEMWITEISDASTIQMSGVATYYHKFVPFLGTQAVDISTCVTISNVGYLRALTPIPVGRIVATRSGSNISVVIQPAVYNTGLCQNSAGAKDATLQTDIDPPAYYGIAQHYTSIVATIINEAPGDNTFAYVQAGSHTLYVRYNWNEKVCAYKSLVVGAGDGDYFGPSD